MSLLSPLQKKIILHVYDRYPFAHVPSDSVQCKMLLPSDYDLENKFPGSNVKLNLDELVRFELLTKRYRPDPSETSKFKMAPGIDIELPVASGTEKGRWGYQITSKGKEYVDGLPWQKAL